MLQHFCNFSSIILSRAFKIHSETTGLRNSLHSWNFIYLAKRYILPVLESAALAASSKDYALASVSMTFSTAAFSLFFAYTLAWGFEGLLVGMALGMAIGVLILQFMLKSTIRLWVSGICIKRMLVFSTPLVFAGLSSWVSLYTDRIMIQYYETVHETGIYGIGYRIASLSTLILIGFQSALTPLVYNNHKLAETAVELAKIFRIFTVFACGIFLVITIFAYDILQLIATPEYSSAASVVIYLTPAVVFSGMYIFAPGIAIKEHMCSSG